MTGSLNIINRGSRPAWIFGWGYGFLALGLFVIATVVVAGVRGEVSPLMVVLTWVTQFVFHPTGFVEDALIRSVEGAPMLSVLGAAAFIVAAGLSLLGAVTWLAVSVADDARRRFRSQRAPSAEDVESSRIRNVCGPDTEISPSTGEAKSSRVRNVCGPDVEI